MKRLNKKELEIIKEALKLQIDSYYEYSYRLEDEEDFKEAKEYKKDAKEVEKVLRKLS